MRVLQEFKSFALRGTVIDMAFGVVVGTAFVNVVTALVNKVAAAAPGLDSRQHGFFPPSFNSQSRGRGRPGRGSHRLWRIPAGRS